MLITVAYHALVGNIRVFCRCRPLNSEEIADGASMAIDFGTDSELSVKSNGALKKSFKFDAVFGPQADQGNNWQPMKWLLHVSSISFTCIIYLISFCLSKQLMFLRILLPLQLQF